MSNKIGSNVVSFSAAISACEKGSQWERGFHLLERMPQAKCAPDQVSLNALISACEDSGQWQMALELLSQMPAASIVPDVTTFSAAISACGQGSQWQRAVQLLQDMPEARVVPNEVSFNAAIGAMASSAFQLFGKRHALAQGCAHGPHCVQRTSVSCCRPRSCFQSGRLHLASRQMSMRL